MDAYELIQIINNLSKSKYLEDYQAYAVNVDSMRGVALVCNENVVIDESFNQVRIKNLKFSISGKQENVIFLFTKNNEMSNKYGMFCLDFLDFSHREIILSRPVEWFYEWRDLLGDSKKNKMIYDVIGEMTLLLELQKKGKNPTWNSMNDGTFDVTTTDSIYEVKSSISKTQDYITIHNQFQLEILGLNKPLYICYIRVEESNAGESIDSLFNELVKNGFDEISLNTYLDSRGYYTGKNERYKQYIIHEMRLYEVDDKFPSITNSSFKDSKIPTGIIKYEYTVSLNGLKYKQIK